MTHGMRPVGALVAKEEALALLLAAARPIARAEEVPLGAARGRVSADEVRAPIDVPPFARATMDGYAVRSADAAAPGARLRVVGEVLAGMMAREPLAPGCAVRIATGAPVPQGADAVVRVEDTKEADGVVELAVPAPARLSVDPAGVDLRRGDLVAGRGALLTPARVGLLASIGASSVRVLARPRVAIFSSGDELLPVGAPAREDRIYDSNSWTLAALFEPHGVAVTRHAALPDERAALERALADAARAHDAVVVTGGASAGAKDLLVDAARALGRVHFHGVRVKPGKPLLAATIGESLLVGLPGNPTSALSNSVLFVVPALRKMAGLPPQAPLQAQARLAAEVRAGDRYLFLPVRMEGEVATPTFKGSGALTSIAESDGWIGVPEGAHLPAGASVTVNAWW